MRTIRKGKAKQAERPTAAAPDEGTVASPAEAPAIASSAPDPVAIERGDDESRVSIAWYEKDGEINFERMRPAMREAIRKLITNPDVAREVGAVPPSVPTAQANFISPNLCAMLYDTLGSIESLAAQKLYDCPPDIAAAAFQFTKAEKDKLAEPTAEVFNRWANEWLKKYQSEAVLIMLLVTMTMGKFQVAKMMMAARAAAPQTRSKVVPMEAPAEQPSPEKVASNN